MIVLYWKFKDGSWNRMEWEKLVKEAVTSKGYLVPNDPEGFLDYYRTYGLRYKIVDEFDGTVLVDRSAPV